METSDDTLLNGRVFICQPVRGYRVAIDPVLLAASVPSGGRGRVLDAGAGIGAAALCFAWRCPKADVTAVEVQPSLCELMNKNITRNKMEGRVRVFAGDILSPPRSVAIGGFDHVMANPPFLPIKRADRQTDADKAISHIEGSANLEAWVDFAFKMLVPGGVFTMIHRSDRLDEILISLNGRAGGVVVFPIWPKAEVSPKRIIVRARRGSSTPLCIDPGLVLHDTDGSYTETAVLVLKNGRRED